jgi:hypothetical protein
MSKRMEAMFSGVISRLQRNNGYLARVEIERILEPLRADPKRLEPHGFKVYSQNDEDGMIEEICRRLGISQGNFVEIGVENGLECNSLYLIHKGWRGLWIEGNLARSDAIQAKFGDIIGKRLTVAFSMVTPDNINPLFEQLRVSDDLDFLSIDIDGNDIHLLDALAIRPKILCIEYNAKFPGNIAKRPVYDPDRRWTGSDYMGSSLKALAQSAVAKGYRLVGANITGSNAFFVRRDLAGDLFPDDASPEHLYQPARYWLWTDHFLHIGHRADFGPYADLQDG